MFTVPSLECYLPPDASELAPPNHSQTGQYSIYLPRREGMEGWVDQGDLLHTETVYSPADGHRMTPIQVVTGLGVD